jgi:hypothetical protein
MQFKWISNSIPCTGSSHTSKTFTKLQINIYYLIFMILVILIIYCHFIHGCVILKFDYYVERRTKLNHHKIDLKFRYKPLCGYCISYGIKFKFSATCIKTKRWWLMAHSSVSISLVYFSAPRHIVSKICMCA